MLTIQKFSGQFPGEQLDKKKKKNKQANKNTETTNPPKQKHKPKATKIFKLLENMSSLLCFVFHFYAKLEFFFNKQSWKRKQLKFFITEHNLFPNANLSH